MIAPGATLGVLGGGQLGRMFAVAARRLGYEVVVLDPQAPCPAGEVASRQLVAPYDDPAALDELARVCAAVTTEFETVPASSLERLEAAGCPVRPSSAAVAVAQDRLAEKTFFRAAGCPTAPFAPVRAAAELGAAVDAVGLPALLKVSRGGYDGKGQFAVGSLAEAEAALASLGGEPCILEARLPLEAELSVVLARDATGHVAAFPPAENVHEQGILDLSLVPARAPAALADDAVALARGLAERLEYCGVLGVELFLSGGRLLVNEVAPRPHNSGHFTLDACATDQFEQQVRALCGLPLGDPRLLTPAVMLNLLGDLWQAGPPPWERVLAHPGARLHLYGKREPRVGRKMGHVTCLAPTLEEALATASAIKRDLSR